MRLSIGAIVNFQYEMLYGIITWKKNDHDTMKTEKDMEPYMNMSTDDITADAEKLLKK